MCTSGILALLSVSILLIPVLLGAVCLVVVLQFGLPHILFCPVLKVCGYLSLPFHLLPHSQNRAMYQTYAHASDIAAFIPSVAVRSMTNDVFTKDDLLLGRRNLSLGEITLAPHTAISTANNPCSSVGL